MGKAALVLEMNDYLAEYGRRGSTWSLAGASWIEDPTPMIKNLQDYIGQQDTRQSGQGQDEHGYARAQEASGLS